MSDNSKDSFLENPLFEKTLHSPEGREPITTFTPDVSFEDVRNAMHRFVDERDWHKFHTPRNLVLALTGEVGELAEIFQWQGEVEAGLPTFTEEQRIHVGEEIADCVLYLTRIAQQCGIDLPRALYDKMDKNTKKYPAERFKGIWKKYNAKEMIAKEDEGSSSSHSQEK